MEDIHLGSEVNAKILFFAGFYSLNAVVMEDWYFDGLHQKRG